MAAKFTPDQQRIIDLRDCNILVSAAAGSGKTTVLVERIAQLVGNAENGIDIDRLLVVTFTKAAAAQMKERLFDALQKKAEAEPENAHLQRQLTLIYNAQITTIDSFCLYLIRNHFNDIGLDPDFRTAKDGEVELLCQDVLGELLEEKFAEKDPDFLHCVECFVPGGREERLEEQIMQLYDFSMSYPFPEDWLKRHRTDLDWVTEKAVEETEWFQWLKKAVRQALSECKRQAQRILAVCEEPDGPHMYAAAICSDLALIEELEAAAGTAETQGAGDVVLREDAGTGADGFCEKRLYEGLANLSFARLSAKRDACVSEEKKALVKRERERVKDILGGLREKYFAMPFPVRAEEMRQAGRALRALVDLTLLFIEKLDARKREKNLLDYADMEHMALRILLEKDAKGNIVPTRTAQEYQEQYREILIDEYQDSNLVQEFLLQSISGEANGRFDRFMVGDVKQSIYKFRLARPELFMEKFDSYQKQGGPCVRVDLKQNFRSRHEVTDSVNDVFVRLMHKKLGGVEYDSDAALYPAAQFPEPVAIGQAQMQAGQGENEDPKTAAGQAETGTCRTAGQGDVRAASAYESEFWVAVAKEEEDVKQAEARLIADRIHAVVGHLQVRDKSGEGMRPAAYRDIVILLRTTAGWDEVFKKVLEECGIPVYITSKTGYFAAGEVQTVLNFLRVLDNPLQDIPLFGVLHSCIGGFSDGEIARLKAADRTGKKRLYDCMKDAADGKEAENGENGEEDTKSGTAGSKGGKAEEIRGDCSDARDDILGGKCREFLDFLARFREYAVYLPIHKLIEALLEETGYLYTISAMPDGSKRRANVEMLLSRAESFEQTSYSGLFHFIRYIGQMEKYNVDYGETETLDENADVVRIMSIHKSKGLEFPVCFVSGLSKRFNRQDTRQPVLMDMDLGLASDCVDPDARTRRATLKKNVLAQKLLEESMGEELRVLYVAMTRAEEKLILTASCREEKAPDSAEADETAPGAFSPGRLMEASGYYDLLLPAWRSAGRPVSCARTADFVREEIALFSQKGNARRRLALSDAGQYLDTKDCKDLAERIGQKYAHENLAELFVKTTVSELKKAGMQEEAENGAFLFPEEEVIPYLPRFVRNKEEGVTGALCGSAYHRFLELFPFERKETADWTAGQVREVMEGLAQSGMLTQDYFAVIHPEKVRCFLQSGLAARMRRALLAGMLWREQPFVLGISAALLKESLPQEETVLIQGIIDVFFEEAGELVVADYKTDAVRTAGELVARYRVQLACYAQALERLTQKPVKQKIIYSFALGEEIVLD